MPLMANAYDVEIDGIYYDLITKAKQATVTSGTTKYSREVVIPESIEHEGVSYSVTSIGFKAFDSCTGLTSISIPNSVTSIGVYAFQGCSRLTSIIIPSSVTSIASYAFNGCSTLTSISIPNNVTSIGTFAFQNCSGLTSVTIGNSVTSIGIYAFYGCNSLTSVNISDLAAWCNISFKDNSSNPLNFAHHLFLNGTEIKDLVIPNSMTSIGNYAFYGCSCLTSLTIPNSVTSIGNYAFSGCSSLTSLTIPNSVSSIGTYAMSSCSALETIVIGNGVKNISGKAFANCKNLIEVTCFAPNVPTTASDAFDNSYIEYATLYVTNSLNDYQNTEPWSGFGNIVSFTPIYKLIYIVDGEEYKTVEYEEGESIIPEPAPTKEGYFFSGWSEIPETMPACDVTVTGSFLLTPICSTPTISILPNGKIKVESATEGATCVTNITVSNVEPLTGDEISLNTPLTVFTVTSYATKEGYDDSEVATATFRYEKTTGDVNGDGNVHISDVTELGNMILGN